MKKIQTLIFLPLLLLNVETLAQTGYSRFGVKAGFNTVEASVNDATGIKVKSGFHFGPTYEHLLSNSFSVQTGVLFSMKRSEVNNLNASDYIPLPPDDTHTLNAAYLILPLQGAYKLHVSKAFKIILGAGPYMGYGVGGKITRKIRTNEISWKTFGDGVFDETRDWLHGVTLKRLDIGAGANLDFVYDHFVLGFSYEHGLRNIANQDHYNRLIYKNRSIGISVGWKL